MDKKAKKIVKIVKKSGFELSDIWVKGAGILDNKEHYILYSISGDGDYKITEYQDRYIVICNITREKKEVIK